MIISYTLDNELIFEINNKDIVKYAFKVSVLTLLSLILKNKSVCAAPTVRKYVDEGTIFIIEKFIEMFYADNFGTNCIDYWIELPYKAIKNTYKILK